MAFWLKDLSVFTGAFGELVTTSTGVSFRGVFDNDYIGVGDVAMESTSPAVTARTEDVEILRNGDTLTVGLVDYYVRNVQPDGTGMTVLRLEKK